MVKKDNGYMQKARSKHSSTRRSKYDQLLDDMGTEEGIPFEALLRPHAWEKQGDKWRRKRGDR
jgi:hypothetical protein|tara:strand:+ start:99 stop:287 length:189 start_codon:yes stop_codon:yes gene_type:complete